MSEQGFDLYIDSSPIGLSNPTNSRCYVNAVMQFIFHNPVFFALLQRNSDYGEICHDKELLTTALHEQYCKDKNISLLDQDVSCDFLHWCCDKFNKGPNISYAFKTTQTRECCDCSTSSSLCIDNTILQIYPTSFTLVDSLDDTLESIVEFKCERCKGRSATITYQINTYPQDLFLAFHQDHTMRNCSVQGDILIDEQRYILMGCIEHTGSVNGGHYKAYMNLENDWYCYNDLKVMPIKVKTMEQKCNGKSSFVCFWYTKI